MSAPAPELPTRVPGTSLALNLNYEVLVTPTLPLVTGEPVCFECEHEPAAFVLTMVQQTFTGGTLTTSNRIGALCVGSVAAQLPRDVDVVITRLRKDPS